MQARQLIEEISANSSGSYPWRKIAHFFLGQEKTATPLSKSTERVNEAIRLVNLASQPSPDRQEYAFYINDLHDLAAELLRLRDETILANPTVLLDFEEVDNDEAFKQLASEFAPFQRVIALRAAELLRLAEVIDQALGIIGETEEVLLPEIERKQIALKKIQLKALQNEVIAAMQKYIALADADKSFRQQGLLCDFISRLDSLLAQTRHQQTEQRMVGHYNDFVRGVPMRLINGHIGDLPQDSSMGNSLLMEEFEDPTETLLARYEHYIEQHTEGKKEEEFYVIPAHAPQLTAFQDFYQQFAEQEGLVSLFGNREAALVAVQEICTVLDGKFNSSFETTEEEDKFLSTGEAARERLVEKNTQYKQQKTAPKAEQKRDENLENFKEKQNDLREIRSELNTYKSASSYHKTRQRYREFILAREIDKVVEERQDNALDEQWKNRALYAYLTSASIVGITGKIEESVQLLEELIRFIQNSKPSLANHEKELILNLKNLIQAKRTQLCAAMLERILLHKEKGHDDVIYDTLDKAKQLGCENPRYYQNTGGHFYQPLTQFTITEEQKLDFIEYLRLHGTKEQKSTLYACYGGRLPNKNGSITTRVDGLDESLVWIEPPVANDALLTSTDFTHIQPEEETEDKGKEVDKEKETEERRSVEGPHEALESLLSSGSFYKMEDSLTASSFFSISPLSSETYYKAVRAEITKLNLEQPIENDTLNALFTLFATREAERIISSGDIITDDQLQLALKAVNDIRIEIDSLVETAEKLIDELKPTDTKDFAQEFYALVQSYEALATEQGEEDLLFIEKAIRDVIVWNMTKSWEKSEHKKEMSDYARQTIPLSLAMSTSDIVKSVENARTFLQVKHDLMDWIVDEQERIGTYKEKHSFYNWFMSNKTTQVKLAKLENFKQKISGAQSAKELDVLIIKLESNPILNKSRNVFALFKPKCLKTTQLRNNWSTFVGDNENNLRNICRQLKV